MAKRKRLEMPGNVPNSPVLETKSAFPPAPRARMPIAEVAGDTAGRAALEDVAREMTAAQEEGRMVRKLPLEKVSQHHLCRDRIVLDEEEMEALMASIRARGQQTPIEVVQTGSDFGLISGLRRFEALRRLDAEEVLAIVRRPESAEAAYRAMIEENEIRANLSFYERANIAFATVGQRVYPNPRAAVAGLFAHTTPAKRSKITKFVTLREQLGKALAFPTAIPEKLGLRLAQALDADPKLAARISDALRKTPPQDAAAERRTIERALKGEAETPARVRDEIAPGLKLETRKGRVVFSGAGVDEAFLQAVRAWAVSHAKKSSASD